MPDTMMTTIELAVITLARQDPLSSVKPSWHSTLFLFNPRSHLPLANPRLEALRRYAVLFRLQRRGMADAERERIRSAGYNPQQIRMIENLIAPPRREQDGAAPSAAPAHRNLESSTPARLNSCPSGQANFPFPPASTAPRGANPVRVFVTYLFHTRFSHPRPRFIAALAMLSLIFWGASAQAQELAQVQEQDSGEDKDHIVIGIGAGYAPAYQGSDKYRALPVPVIDVSWGPFFANLQNGIGVNAIDTDHITIGASVTVMQGYRSKDAPDGIGKLSFGAGGRGFMDLKAAGFVATIGATKGFAGNTKGLIADASLSYPLAVTSRLTLVPTIGTTWADKKHNDRFYGVNSKQSLASGLPQFRAGSGFNDASFMLSAQYRLTERFSLGATGGVTTLLGKVKDSPIVFHKTQPLGFLSLSYRFR